MKKILIIRFSSIGDIVLTTPVIRCLKKQLSDAEIHFITKSQYKNVLSSNPYIDRLITFDKSLNEVIPLLKKEKYNYIIDLHKNIRSLLLRFFLIRVPCNSFNKLTLKKWVLVTFHINILPDKHIVDRYFDTVKFLHIKNDGQGLDFFYSDDDVFKLTDLPVSHQQKFVAIMIGSKHTTKQMPVDKLISICQKISNPIVLIGGKEDREKGEVIQKTNREKMVNLCGIYTIGQTASIIKHAESIITPDTGIMHIAAALNKKIFSIWGNTVPAFGMYPYFPEGINTHSEIIEVKGLNCRPCSRLGFKDCPKKHFKCMNLLDENQIAELTNQ